MGKGFFKPKVKNILIRLCSQKAKVFHMRKYFKFKLMLIGYIYRISGTFFFENPLVSVRRLRELQPGKRFFGNVVEFDGHVSLELYRSLHHAGQFGTRSSV